MKHFVGILSFLLVTSAWATPSYPPHWWTPVSQEGAPAWEVLPQEAKTGEVILSKRNELGILSNFAPTPFVFRGKPFASLEGFWQSMLYPENSDDLRAKAPGVTWKYTRNQVAAMVSFEAKAAGDLAFENMKKMKINWVSFEGKHMTYLTKKKGEHYRLIVEATREKVKQNPRVLEVLLSTRGLKLRPDHHQPSDAPPSWHYYDILSDIRDQSYQLLK